jgi:hypothetical protein
MTLYNLVMITDGLRQNEAYIDSINRRVVEQFQDSGVVDLDTIQIERHSRNNFSLNWEVLYTAETPD